MSALTLQNGLREKDLHDSLLRHARDAAGRCIATLGAPLFAENLKRFLAEPDCMKWPVTLVFDDASLESHQFAQPVFVGFGGRRRCELHVHPHYANRPECLVFIVAYMAGAINYGPVVTIELCEHYGAALMALSQNAFYTAVCKVADQLPLDLVLPK